MKTMEALVLQDNMIVGELFFILDVTIFEKICGCYGFTSSCWEVSYVCSCTHKHVPVNILHHEAACSRQYFFFNRFIW